MVDSTLAFDILARDHASSTFDKVARSADKTAAALKRSAKISDDVAKAEMRLSKARDSESDSMGRVKVAEQRLQELRDKGLQGTSRFTAAEEALSSARRKAAQSSNTAKIAEDSLGKARAKLVSTSETVGKEAGGEFSKGFSDEADKEGSKSLKKFGSSLKRWLTGNGADIGKQGGTVFGSGFLGALKTPILGPAIVGVIGAAVATALPAVGAIAAGGLVAGFGAGLAGLGIVFAAQSRRVGHAWSMTLSRMGEDMKLLSTPFQDTLVNIAGYAQRTFDKFNPALSKAFANMAPVVDRFVDSASRSLEQLVPAIAPISNAFGKVLDAMGPALQSAIGNVARGLTDLANSVAKNPQALADTVAGVGNLVRSALDLVRILNDVNGKFETLTGGTSMVDVVMKGLQGTLMPLMTLFSGLGKVIDLVNAAVGRTGKDVEGAGAAASKAANDTVELAQAYQKTGEQAAHAAAPLKIVTDALTRQKLAFTSTIAAMGQWADKAIASSNASIALEQAIDDASASVKDNGKTLDINTAKGRANQTALNNLASAAKAQMTAMDDAGDSNVKVAATGEKSRATFIKMATQMGLTKAQAKVLADALIKIPNVSREAKLTANKKDLETKLAAAKRELANPNLTKERKAKLNADIAKLNAAIARAKAALAGVPTSKTVTITSRFITERIIRTQTTSGGGHAPGFASGGLIPGRPSSKDNHLRPMATGEFVVQASQVAKNRALLESINAGRRPAQFASGGGGGGGGGGGTVVLEFRSDGSPHMEYLITEFRKYIRVQGGNVQAVLGR